MSLPLQRLVSHTTQPRVGSGRRALTVQQLSLAPRSTMLPGGADVLRASTSYAPTTNGKEVNGNGVHLHADIDHVLYSEAQLNDCLRRLGTQLGNDYRGKHVLVLGVLKGGFMFTADLIRHITPVPAVMEVDFIKASSYGVGTETSGQVRLGDGFDLKTVRGKHVVVMEDIVDSGLTLSKIVATLKAAGPLSVKVVALLDKRARRKVVFNADYVGFDCPDEFVVGYGIDYAERFRFLPYVGVPKDEAVPRIADEVKAHSAQHHQ